MPALLLTGGLPTRSPAMPGIHTLGIKGLTFLFLTATANQSTVVFPEINREQFDYITKRFATIPSAIEEMLQKIERSINIEEKKSS